VAMLLSQCLMQGWQKVWPHGVLTGSAKVS
jgi:hypothetical protein